MRQLLSLALAFCLSGLLHAQAIPLDSAFAYQLSNIGIDFVHPIGSDFRPRPNEDLRLLEIDQTLYSRQEKLEVRLAVISAEELGDMATMPHIAASRIIMDLGSNDEMAPPITVHSFGSEEMEYFNADWARQFTFRPKQGQAPYQLVQLTALFKEGCGMAYVLLLFNQPPETLDARQQLLRFRHTRDL